MSLAELHNGKPGRVPEEDNVSAPGSEDPMETDSARSEHDYGCVCDVCIHRSVDGSNHGSQMVAEDMAWPEEREPIEEQAELEMGQHLDRIWAAEAERTASIFHDMANQRAQGGGGGEDDIFDFDPSFLPGLSGEEMSSLVEITWMLPGPRAATAAASTAFGSGSSSDNPRHEPLGSPPGMSHSLPSGSSAGSSAYAPREQCEPVAGSAVSTPSSRPPPMAWDSRTADWRPATTQYTPAGEARPGRTYHMSINNNAMTRTHKEPELPVAQQSPAHASMETGSSQAAAASTYVLLSPDRARHEFQRNMAHLTALRPSETTPNVQLVYTVGPLAGFPRPPFSGEAIDPSVKETVGPLHLADAHFQGMPNERIRTYGARTSSPSIDSFGGCRRTLSTLAPQHELVPQHLMEMSCSCSDT
ncbi:hypothetical protein B0I35DRAFT_97162 [Stachybotrys elegans]|uniref:Uncharacterized protein n=1 Tax=Stachybotrys elegans TaxID=80388 RepID=A0A8K0SKR7_9HYPO|nr:hypothetical protein B0I35DRAFT_97162 [Stachybotrys elegans]